MLSRRFTRLVPFLAAAGAGAGAWLSRGTPLVCGVLALVGAGLLALGWVRARRRESNGLHDPAVSTLVFPPESKFQQSAMPRN